MGENNETYLYYIYMDWYPIINGFGMHGKKKKSDGCEF